MHDICNYSSVKNVSCVPLYTFCKLIGWYTATDWSHLSLHSSSARLDGIYPVQFHLIGIRDSPDQLSVRN